MYRRTNAKEELLIVFKDYNLSSVDVIAFNFRRLLNYKLVTKGTILTNEELDKLDFNYDRGYGCQELFGEVLFNDGTWLSRGEYDGSEWWEYNIAPTVEEVLEDKI